MKFNVHNLTQLDREEEKQKTNLRVERTTGNTICQVQTMNCYYTLIRLRSVAFSGAGSIPCTNGKFPQMEGKLLLQKQLKETYTNATSFMMLADA